METYTPKLFDVLTLDIGGTKRRYHVLKLWTLLSGDIVVTLDTRVKGGGYGGSVLLSQLAGNILKIEGGK